MTSPTPDWVNVVNNGAVGDGVTDDTAAIQAVLTAAESNANGTTVYFPAGTYMVTGLTYSSAYPLVFKGDGYSSYNWIEGLSCIQAIAPATSTVPVHLVDVSDASAFIMEGLGLLAAQTASSAYTNDYIGLNLSSVPNVHINRSAIQRNLNGNLFNTAIKTDSGVKNFMCDDFETTSNVYGYWMDGSMQVSFRNANMGTTAGAGGATFYMTNGAGTLRLTNVQTDQGDRGIWMSSNGGSAPEFLFMNDVELNNYALCGMQFDQGGSVWANQVWCSGVGVSPYPASAIECGSGFTGVAFFTQCSFQGHSQGTVTLSGGTGFGFSQCVWGFEAKLAANTYDELHIGGSVSNVTVTGCHFNVDPFYGPGSVTARAAIWVGSGATQIGVCNSICAAANDYGDGAGHGGDTSIGVWTGNLGGWNS